MATAPKNAINAIPMKLKRIMASLMNYLDLSQHAADVAFSLSNGVAIVGAVLVLIGTSGIFWSGGIREKYADERIAKNEADTAKAQEGAANAVKAAAEANERAAEATRKTSELELARVQLEARLAPRRLTAEQQTAISQRLAKFSGQRALVFASADPEPATLAHTLATTLRAAGWVVQEISGVMFGTSIVTGIAVQIPVGANAHVAAMAAAVVDALSSHGLSVSGPVPTDIRSGNPLGIAGPDAEIAVVIGTK